MRSIVFVCVCVCVCVPECIYVFACEYLLLAAARKWRILTKRPDTRLPKSREGGQGPYLSSPEHFGMSSMVKE